MKCHDIPRLRWLLPALIWLCFCVTVVVQPSTAQPLQDCRVAPLSNASDFHIDLGPFACALSDDSRTLTLSDVLSIREDVRFDPVPGGLVDFGFGSSRYWVRVQLQNISAEPGTWWITHDMPMPETLNVHLVPDQGGADVARALLTLTGRDPFSARPIAHRHLVSEIMLKPNEVATLVIDYTSGQATEMPLIAEAVPHFFKRTQAETVQIIALTALVLGMGLISTIYLYGLDGRPALAYGAYVLASAVLLVHLESYTFQYVWPNAPGFNQIGLPVIGPLSVALGTFFVDRFTQATVHHPRLHVAAVTLIVMLALVALLSSTFMSTVWFKLIGLIATVATTVTQVLLAIAALRRGQSGAKFLVLGFGALAVSISFGALGYLTEGLFEQELAGLAIRVGFLAEAMAFSAAIALRVRAARQERDAALSEQLRMTEERLNLSEALRRAEVDRQIAADAALRSQEALASTAHDIRQPLASLQMALSDRAAGGRVSNSLKYLEDIIRTGLEENSAPLGSGDADPPMQNARERFCADIVLKNIEAMFGAEAVRRGISLNVINCTSHLVADPLALMRSVGNLVSNALQHANAQRVLVGCRRRSGVLCFEVHDDGQGIPAAELERILQRGQKGPLSGGHGLGLAIISDLADENGFVFEILPTRGRGTVARILVPAPVRPISAFVAISE